MATILDALKSISGYPIPLLTIETIAIKRDINLADTATKEAIAISNYRLATADVMMWVSFAPNVSQGGVDYNMLVTDREKMRAAANAIYGEFNDDAYIPDDKAKFGYKGEWL